MNSGKRSDIFGVAEGCTCVMVGVAGWRPSDTAAHTAVCDSSTYGCLLYAYCGAWPGLIIYLPSERQCYLTSNLVRAVLSANDYIQLQATSGFFFVSQVHCFKMFLLRIDPCLFLS